MTKRELINLLVGIPDDDQIVFQPDSELFIEEGLVGFGVPSEPKKKVFWLDESESQYFDKSEMHEKFETDKYPDVPEESEFEEYLGQFEKLDAWVIKLNHI